MFYLFYDFHIKTGTRFSLRDKRLFELSNVEIARVDSILFNYIKQLNCYTILVRTKIFHFITKTCLYNFDHLKPHFYIVKLGFTGVYSIFLISTQNIDCGYSLEPPRRGGSNEYPQFMF